MEEIIRLYMNDVDVSLLRENKKLSHEQRVAKLMKLQQAAEAVREAGKRLRAEKRKLD